MNRATMTLALALFTCCSQACAQKSSTTEKAANDKATKAQVKSEAKSTAPGEIQTAAQSNAQANAQAVAPAVAPADKTQAKSSAKAGKPAVTTKSEKATTKPETTSTKSTSTKSTSKNSDGKSELTAEQDKQIKSLIRSTMRGFAKAELTDEQKSKADEILSKTTKDFVVKRTLAEITEEMQKQQAAAMKAKAGDKSVKEHADAAFATAGFTAEQIKVFKSTQTSMNKAKRDIGKLLSEEQIAKLPEPLQKIIRGGK